MRDLAPIILDMFIYRIKSLLIIRSILLWPPPSRQVRPSPHPVSLRVRPAGGWEPPRASPLYLSPDILPCITALALLGCSYPRHTLLHHIPSSLHVGPDPQTSLPRCGQTSWPAQAAPQVDTLLTGFRSLHSHPHGQTGCKIQEERPPSQQVPYWRGWGRRGRILGSGPPVLKLLLLLLPFCSGCWRFWSPVNWNVMNSSDHYQPVQCVRGTMYSEQFLAKISQDLGSCMMFLQKVSLESGTRKKNWVLLR